MIHGAGHSSDECKVLGKFGTKYDVTHPMKYRGSDTIPRKGPRKKKENHTLIDNMVDELRMVEFKKISAVNH